MPAEPQTTRQLHEIDADRRSVEAALDAMIGAVTDQRVRPTRGWSMGCAALMDKRDKLEMEREAASGKA